MLKRVAAHFPHPKLIKEYPDASHLLLEDKPTEVSKEIEIFLTSNLSKTNPINSVENKPKAHSLTESTQYGDLNLVQSFFQKASQFAEHSASIEVKLPSLLSSWPFSRLIGTDANSISYRHAFIP